MLHKVDKSEVVFGPLDSSPGAVRLLSAAELRDIEVRAAWSRLQVARQDPSYSAAAVCQLELDLAMLGVVS